MTSPPVNSHYNVIETLIHLNKGLWDDLVAVWTPDTEEFIKICYAKHDLTRTVAYTYWHNIWWAQDIGFPLNFFPGNDYFRRHPEHALDGLANI